MTDLLQLLASPRRRRLLHACWAEERSAGELHRALGEVSFGAVSQHLRLLREARLVACRPVGRRRLYRARPEALGRQLRSWLESHWDRALGELAHLAELEAGTRRPGDPPR